MSDVDRFISIINYNLYLFIFVPFKVKDKKKPPSRKSGTTAILPEGVFPVLRLLFAEADSARRTNVSASATFNTYVWIN